MQCQNIESLSLNPRPLPLRRNLKKKRRKVDQGISELWKYLETSEDEQKQFDKKVNVAGR